MQKPTIILDMLRRRSLNKYDISDIYRYLYNSEWYIQAYKNITNETDIDHLFIQRIDNMISDIRTQRYMWGNYKNIKITNRNLKYEPLQQWRDRIMQEVIRMILESIYEPKFKESSHAFRPDRGIHTALTDIAQHSRAAMWFIVYDIENFTESMDHSILLNILHKTIKDGRFIELCRKMLKSKVFIKPYIQNTFSGITISKGMASLLLNIYLNELDEYIDTTIITKYTIGVKRSHNIVYNRNKSAIEKIKHKLNDMTTKVDKAEYIKQLHELKKEQHTLDSKKPIKNDTFRRLSYVRYANQMILSLIGTHEDATHIRDNITTFCKDNLQLYGISDIIPARDDKARFLNYNIQVQMSNTKICSNGARNINGNIAFFVPDNVVHDTIKLYQKNNKPCHISSIVNYTVCDIIDWYQMRYKEFVNYYKFTRNQGVISYIKWVMQVSMMKTLSLKLKVSCAKLYKRFSARKIINGYAYKIILYKYINPLTHNVRESYFGGIPNKRVKPSYSEYIKDIKSVN